MFGWRQRFLDPAIAHPLEPVAKLSFHGRVLSTNRHAIGLVTQAFGLSPVFACAPYSERESFNQLWARLGSLANPKATTAWAVGNYQGARVIVTQHTTDAKLFSGNNVDGTAFWVDVLLELERPLFMGARVNHEFESTDSFELLTTGVPFFDNALRFKARDLGKLSAMFMPRTAEDHAFLDALVRAAKDGFFIADSHVGFRLASNRTDAAKIGGALQACLWFRRVLAERSARVPLRPEEQARIADWAAFAASRGLDFDAPRAVMSGVIDGIPVDVSLDPGGFTDTIVVARWPRQLTLQLRVTKLGATMGRTFEGTDLATKQAHLFLLGQDIKIGDPKFDVPFQVEGFPEPEVKRVLASEDLRARLVAIGSRASEVNVTERGLSWTVFGQPTRDDIAGHLQMAVDTAHSMFGRPAVPAPYR